MRISSCLVLLGVLSLVGCGGESTPPPPAVDGGGLTDLGGGETDARVICTSDVDCNDGLFCNGREMCAPASSMADVRGCVPGDAPCSDTETCDETANDCRVTCEDLDGDGHEAPGCGGDDCDDTDASRYPGNTEVCNATDEDCNDATLGFVDGDGDGVASSACCNGASCGGDCNDGNADVRPGALDGPPDLCNTIDDDCDGSIDEGCPCTTGTETPCYTGAASTRGVGRCADGFQLCVGGMLQVTCNDQQLPDTEICDTLDNDCDGMTNEDVLRRYYRDGDADGFGLATESIEACSPPMGYVSGSNDCADDDNNRNPGAFDGCNGIDDDCDGMADEGAPPLTFYRDMDGDGFGLLSAPMTGCDRPVGHVLDSTDCDDASNATNPAAFERCDGVNNDCDTTTDEGCACTDGASMPCDVSTVGVCRSGRQLCVAGAWGACLGSVVASAETCNGLDDDCDASVDELVTVPCYADGDSDAFGAGAMVARCRDTSRGAAFGECPSGYTNVATDCNDASASIRPGAAEVCNGIDDNCALGADELVRANCYADADSDGYGAGVLSSQCRDAARAAQNFCPVGFSNLATDCNDTQNSIRPAGVEACNGVDDDCDTAVDESVQLTFYRDADGDGFGTLAMPTQACTAPAGYVVLGTDCNDANASLNPAATERCDGVNNDCDGTTDEGCACTDGTSMACGTSSMGMCRRGTQACVSGTWTDCAGNVEPGIEACNGLDDDCDGTVDETLRVTCYGDGDGDSYGAGVTSSQCNDPARAGSTFGGCPAGYSYRATDCVDSNAAVSPGAVELCNNVDDDCDGLRDEGLTVTCYVDGDSDGDGALGSMSSSRCSDAARPAFGSCPVGYTNDATDCNDSSGLVRVGASEVCNGVDDDCDASVDEGVMISFYRDGDGDGFGCGGAACGCSASCTVLGCGQPPGYERTSTDCDDVLASRNPGAPEVCDGVDNDCDAAIDDGVQVTRFRDVDGDGFGAGAGVLVCPGAAGYADLATDCSDGLATVFPGQSAYFSAPICGGLRPNVCGTQCCATADCIFGCTTGNFDYDCNAISEREPLSPPSCAISCTFFPRNCGTGGVTYAAGSLCGSNAVTDTANCGSCTDFCTTPSVSTRALRCH